MSKTMREHVEEEAQDFLTVCGKPPTVVQMGVEAYKELFRSTYSDREIRPPGTVYSILTSVGEIQVLVDPNPDNKRQRVYRAAVGKETMMFFTKEEPTEPGAWPTSPQDSPEAGQEVIAEEGTLPCPHCGEPTILATGSLCEDFEVDDEPYKSGVVEKPKSRRETVHVHFEGISVHFCEKCGKVVSLDIDGMAHMEDYEAKPPEKVVAKPPEEAIAAPTGIASVPLHAVFEKGEYGMETSVLIMVTQDAEKAKAVWGQGGAVRLSRRGLVVGDRVYLLDEEHPEPLEFDVNLPEQWQKRREAALAKLTEEERVLLGVR